MTKPNITAPVENLARESFNAEQLCSICGIDESMMEVYIEHLVLIPDPATNTYGYRQLTRLLKAVRLQRDLEVNVAGAALAIQLLEDIDVLKKELQRYRKTRTL